MKYSTASLCGQALRGHRNWPPIIPPASLKSAYDVIIVGEGGLTCSFEKLILDAIAEVGPGGHFFGSAHTLERYQHAFYQPILSDWRNFETWQEDGAKTATQRASEIWQQLLREYEKPPIDPAIEEELQAYMANRKQEIGNE